MHTIVCLLNLLSHVLFMLNLFPSYQINPKLQSEVSQSPLQHVGRRSAEIYDAPPPPRPPPHSPPCPLPDPRTPYGMSKWAFGKEKSRTFPDKRV